MGVADKPFLEIDCETVLCIALISPHSHADLLYSLGEEVKLELGYKQGVRLEFELADIGVVARAEAWSRS